MKRTTINFIINALMFFCMSAVAGIGLLIKYTLVSGQERWVIYGENINLHLLGMDRHEWGTIHLIIGYVLIGLLVLHIILHWKLIVCVCNCLFKKKLIRKLISIIFITICALFIIVPFLITPDVYKINKGTGTHAINKSVQKTEFKNENSGEIKSHLNTSIEVRGYMTLNEISVRYKIPTDSIKTNLNIPKSISDNQRLSWLRKKYNIEMSDVAEIIKEYQKNE